MQDTNTLDSNTKVYRKRAVFLTCLIITFCFMLYAGSAYRRQTDFFASTAATSGNTVVRISGQLASSSTNTSTLQQGQVDSLFLEPDSLSKKKTSSGDLDHVTDSSVTAPTQSSLTFVSKKLTKTNSLFKQRYNSATKPNTAAGVDAHCNFPAVDPFSKEIMGLVKLSPTVNCSTGLPTVVKVLEENMLKIDQAKVGEKLGNRTIRLNCRYRSHWMEPGGDFKTAQSEWSKYFTDHLTLGTEAEHIVVECIQNGKEMPVAKSYHSLVRRLDRIDEKLRKSRKKHFEENKIKETLNIIVLGIDGLSRPQMMRTMPKTRQYLQDIGALELTRFNKVGMNTFPNVMALLTGKTVEEHTQWNVTKPMDTIPFIWSNFQRSGYYTQLILDRTKVTAFHCSKLGWTRPPVHFYNRATVVASEADESIRSAGENCIGDVPEVTSLLDYQLRLARSSKKSSSSSSSLSSSALPFFSYSFFVHLTHDDTNQASAGDELYKAYFQQLVEDGITNNTVVIFFSDHGPRFGPLRRTQSGMLEGPTPFSYVMFPEWFLEKYPPVQRALSANQNRLVTAFDLHATMKHLLNFTGSDHFGDTTGRSVSLLQEIPGNRTCDQAGVRMEWCACNRHLPVDTNSLVIRVLAYDFVQRLSEETDEVRNMCQRLTFKSLKSAFRVILSHTETKDRRLREARLYKMMVETSPGGGIFEGVLEFSPSTNKTRIVGSVDRLNMFQTQSRCMKTARYKPFCFCKDLDDV